MNYMLHAEYTKQFYGNYTGQPLLASSPVKNSKVLIIACMLLLIISAVTVSKTETESTDFSEFTCHGNVSFYARQHICYSAYMPWQFRLSVCHTGGSVKNG